MPVTSDQVADEWIEIAERDLAVAESLWDVFPDAAAFHIQQAIEKLLKAALVRNGARVPRIHNLLELRRLVGPDLDWTATDAWLGAVTDWNAASRYPDVFWTFEPTTERVVEAAGLARALLAVVRTP